MRVVVTGATGMIGTALIKQCIHAENKVLAIVRNDTKRLGRLPQSALLEIQYADLDHLDEIVLNGEFYDVFYHLAWGHTAKEERDNPTAQEDNIRTTLHAVELAHRLGCRTFIGAGSQAEYGYVDGIIKEETTPNPVTSYGIAKLSANMMSRRMCDQLGMDHIWARIFSCYGNNDNKGTMLDYAIGQFIKGEPAKFSSASQMWNYIHEDDAGMMFYLLGKNDVNRGIYNIAGKESKPLKEYIREMADIFGTDAICEFARADDGVKLQGIEPDISKIVNAVGYEPQVAFRDGIFRMIEFKKAVGRFSEK